MSVIASFLRGTASNLLPLSLLKQRQQTLLFQCLAAHDRSRQNFFSDRKSGPDYYAVLGITRAAEPQQVKMAYFQRAKKYHPDSNPTKEAKWMFELIAEAYDVLSDEQKRRNFDEYGTVGESFGSSSSTGPTRPKDHMNYSSEELFGKIFGEAGRQEQEDHNLEFGESLESQGATKEHIVNLTFEEAAKGAEITITISLKTICDKCHGDKGALGYTWQICVFCDGTGVETQKIGHVANRRTCTYCNGTRQYFKYKCDACEGIGVVTNVISYTVEIPSGAENGQVLAMPVERERIGEHVLAESSVVYLYLKVAEDNYFQKSEFDVVTEADLTISQALLGGELHVRGLHKDRIEVEVPGLTGSHKTLLKTGEGIRRSDGMHQGHHFVKAGIKPPERLSEFQRELLLRFATLDESQQIYGAIEGVETADSHRYSAGVIDPDQVQRYFNSAEEKERKQREKKEKKTMMTELAKDWRQMKESVSKNFFS